MRFACILGGLTTFVAVLPFLIGLLSQPPGGTFLGYMTNADDHMVYAAWMTQAMEGRILFENRFTTEAQPGLSFHLFFLVLGWVAYLVGIPLATTIARAVFCFLFVWLLALLFKQMKLSVFSSKFALFLTVFGGGIGFLAWEMFGQVLATERHPVLSTVLQALLAGRLPIDVWQPEAFVFPSMLTNALFMASLCLIVWFFISVLRAREGWAGVWQGAVAYGLLMNIHSYDVLMIVLVLIAFLVASLASGQATLAWVIRTLVMTLGALPAALWFVYVWAVDPVFRARAATETFSPSYQQILVGLLPLVVLAMVALLKCGKPDLRLRLGLAALAILSAFLYTTSYGRNPDEFYVGLAGFLGLFTAGLIVVALVAKKDHGWNLMWAWAIAILLAPAFPALFQRKLAMGMSIPWAILAALGLAAIVESRERHQRNLTSVIPIVLLACTSVLWLQREMGLQQLNVSSTTVHAVTLGPDSTEIVHYLREVPGRKVVLAMPGIPVRHEEMANVFLAPFVPDLNPVLVGMAGATAYAGHWSETPRYAERRSTLLALFMAQTSDATRRDILLRTGADYIVTPDASLFPDGSLADLRPFGSVVYDGTRFDLIEVQTSGP